MSDLKEFMDSGLAIRKGARYYINIGEEEVLLGQGKEKSQDKLDQLLADGKLQAPSNSSQPSIEATPELTTEVPQEGKLPKIMPRKSASKKKLSKAKLQSLLGEIEDLKPTLAGSLDVFYLGANMFDYHHPVVRELGIILRWRKKQDKDTGNLIIDDGRGNLTCNGYQVLVRDRFQDLVENLDIKRDDTPKERYITNGDLVLCIARKDQYDEKQIKKNLQHYQASKAEHEKNKAIGQNLSKHRNVQDAHSSIQGQLSKDSAKDSQYQNDLAEVEKLSQEL